MNRDRLIAFLDEQSIALEFNERIAPALGVSYGGKIALLPGQSKAGEFTTLVHETAHELLHKAVFWPKSLRHGSLQQSPEEGGSSLLESSATFQLPSGSFFQTVM